jgi:O-antigen ligase
MGRTLRVMQGVTAGTPAAMALVFVRAGIDVFTTVKATLAVLAAIAVVWLVASDRVRGGPAGFRGRHASLAPPTDFALVAAGLATVLGIATLAAPSPARAVVGEAGRHSGLAVWLAAIVLAVAASIVARHDRGRGLVLVTVAASLPVSVYALSQGVGADLVTWSPVEGGPQVFATLGNADYLSAWLGMVLPLAVATLLDETWPPIWRLTAMAAGLLGLSAAVVSGSLQGPVSGVVGSALVVGMWGGGPGWRLRRRRIAGLGMVLLLVAGVTVALVAVAVSPTGVLASAERSLEARLPIWRAAWDMSGRAPMVGVGPGHFGDYWFTDRPDSAVPVPREVVGASAAAPPRGGRRRRCGSSRSVSRWPGAQARWCRAVDPTGGLPPRCSAPWRRWWSPNWWRWTWRRRR